MIQGKLCYKNLDRAYEDFYAEVRLSLKSEESLSAVLHTPVLSSPIYGIFSLRSGEDSYALFIFVLIGRPLSAAGNRLIASFRLKPIFHQKTGLRWVPDANEISTKNMKCTCPTQRPNARTLRHLYSTGNWVCVCYPMQRNVHTKNEMYMANTRNWRHLTQKIPTCWYFLR